MSSAKSRWLSQRLISPAKGLLDRFESGLDLRLDAGFTRTDALLERQIKNFRNAQEGLASGLASMAQSTDAVLDNAISQSAFVRIKAATQPIFSSAKNLESRIDVKLTQSLDAIDRAILLCTNAADRSVAASLQIGQRLENQTQRSFHHADQALTNVSNRILYTRTKTAGLIHQGTSLLEQKIEMSFTRVDDGLSQAFNLGVGATHAAITSAQATSQAFDAAITNSLSDLDAQVARGVYQVQLGALTSRNLVNSKALAFERVLELGISRIDSGIERSLASGAAANQALAGLLDSTDHDLVGRLTRSDESLNSAITKVTSTFSHFSGYATRNLTSADARLTTSLRFADASIDTAVTAIVSAATATTSFATRSAQATDATLWRGLTKVEKHVEVFAGQSNAKSRHAGKRAKSAPAWVAAGLALVLGTIGTATGTSVVTAESAPVEIDNSAQSEIVVAKSVVSQYMTVRESFAALQASRSRSITTLETEIEQAQVKALQTTIDGKAVVDIASQYAGVSYARGGTTPRGFDCSGFTTYIFKQVGVSLPRTSGEQAAWADRVAASDRQVGDLMFWEDRGGVHHVAIYAGDGLMWDSPRPGRRVGKISIWGDPFYGRVPAAAVNSGAIAEIVDKTAELEELQANVPQLEITVDPTPVD